MEKIYRKFTLWTGNDWILSGYKKPIFMEMKIRLIAQEKRCYNVLKNINESLRVYVVSN